MNRVIGGRNYAVHQPEKDSPCSNRCIGQDVPATQVQMYLVQLLGLLYFINTHAFVTGLEYSPSSVYVRMGFRFQLLQQIIFCRTKGLPLLLPSCAVRYRHRHLVHQLTRSRA